jgi:aryl-alcohol dehydrogenase-like predicted oxidoreductase
MVYRVFGKTGWRVSQLGVGCWQFGGAITLDGKPDGWTGVNDEESHATIRRALELGVNFFDTADMYGWGHSEEVLGRALKEALPALGGRDRFYVATKVGFGHDEAGRRTFHESVDYILQACDASLRRLQVNHIDLYQCHLWRTERWPDFLEAFDRLQRAGKIRFFGVSTNDLDMVQHFDGHKNLAAVQANYNLLDRRAEQALLPYCRARGIAFIARGPLAMGKLSGRLNREPQFDPNDIRNKWLEPENRPQFERDLDTIERLKPIAARGGFALPQLALKFALSHVAVSTVIVGTKNREQLEDNLAVAFLPALTRVELTALDEALRPE